MSLSNANQVEDIIIEPYSGDSTGSTEADKLGGEMDFIAFTNLVSITCEGNDITAIHNFPDSLRIANLEGNKLGNGKLSEYFVANPNITNLDLRNNAMTLDDVEAVIISFYNVYVFDPDGGRVLDMRDNGVTEAELTSPASGNIGVLKLMGGWEILLDE